jgi:drug/metabolite transporter (DMT)-like permease
VVWGLIWYPYRILNEFGFSAIHSSLFIFTSAICISLFLYPIKNLAIFKQRSFWVYAFVGGVTNIAYALAIIEGDLVRVMLLFFLSPVWTLPFTYIFLNESVKPQHILAAVISIVGAAIILWHPHIFTSRLGLGDTYAIIGGIGFALTNVLARTFTQFSVKEKSYAIWFGVVFIAIFVMVFLSMEFKFKDIDLPSLSLFTLVGCMLLFTTMIVQNGLVLVDAVRASPVFLFEIIVVAISGFYLANEVIHVKDFFGGLFIITGVLISSRQ